MRNTLFVLGSALLSASMLVSCDNKKDKPAATTTVAVTPGAPSPNKIAYVNIDTFQANYEPMKVKSEDFRKRQEAMENELQRSYQQMQSDAEQVQKKAEANTLTQSEYESAQKRLYQMQKSFESRKQSLTEQLMKDQEDFNKELKTKLDAFLDEYNKTRHYDYILSYSYAGSSILYVNKELDITKDIVEGMNAAAKTDAEKKSK
jgi:outer membrane protein